MSHRQIRFALASVVLAIATVTVGCAEDNNSPGATEPAPTTTTIAATATSAVTPTTTVELSPEFVLLMGEYSWGRSEGVASLQEVLGIRADGEYGPKTREAHQEALAYLGVENYDFPLAPWETPTTTAAPRSVTQNYLRPSISLECPDDVEDFGEYSWWRMSFGYNIRWDARAGFDRIKIDYGDGRSYTSYSDSDAEVNAFWHKYWNPGTFRVRATITDGQGKSDTATCSWTWTSYWSGGGSTYYDSGGGYRTGAVCADGSTSSATGSGACSWHGGVDYWLD